MALLLVFAFLGGVMTIVSPCVLPVLPILLSGTVGGRGRPVGIVLGFVGSFALFTLTLAALVRATGVSPDTLRAGAVVVLIAFGLTLLVPNLQHRFEALAARVLPHRVGSARPGLVGGLLVGVTLGLVWTPCVGPIMAIVVTLAAGGAAGLGALALTLAYGVGAALPMFAVMLGGRRLLARVPALTTRAGDVQRAFGALLVVFAGLMLFGVDRRVQAVLLDRFPGAAALAALDDRPAVRRELDRLGR